MCVCVPYLPAPTDSHTALASASLLVTQPACRFSSGGIKRDGHVEPLAGRPPALV